MYAPSAPLRDCVVPAALAALTVWDVVANGTSAFPRPLWLVGAVLVAACLVLIVRRSRPGFAAVAASALVTLYLLVLHGDLAQQPAIEPFLVLVVAFFSLGAHAASRSLLIGGGISSALLLSAEGLALASGRPIGEVFPSLLFWVVAGVVGRLLHFRHRESEHARERATRAEQERDLHARQATIEERTRIARELHDIVAHSLSVMVIQASVEARLMEDKNGSTATTLRTIEETGREALTELRRLLGLLRTDEENGDAVQPMPSLRDLENLLHQLRRAGHNVSLDVTGESRDLPPGVDLSAYRIAQEALTNAFKHAPGSTVRVRVDYLAHAVTVAVEDDGARQNPSPQALEGSGHGLVGMRERVRVYDGQFEAGPRERGGFGVKALIPAPSEGT
jgi:signal transduction histidine kinase